MNNKQQAVSDLEEIRLRNLQMSRDLLKRDKHWTDMEFNAYFLKMHEDMVKLSHVMKRLIDPFS